MPDLSCSSVPFEILFRTIRPIFSPALPNQPESFSPRQIFPLALPRVPSRDSPLHLCTLSIILFSLSQSLQPSSISPANPFFILSILPTLSPLPRPSSFPFVPRSPSNVFPEASSHGCQLKRARRASQALEAPLGGFHLSISQKPREKSCHLSTLGSGRWPGDGYCARAMSRGPPFGARFRGPSCAGRAAAVMEGDGYVGGRWRRFGVTNGGKSAEGVIAR